MIRTISSAIAMLIALAACGPSHDSTSTTGAGATGPAPTPGALRHVQTPVKPEITTDQIVKDVVGRAVRVFEVRGALPPTEWTFEADESKHAEILEKHMTDTAYTVVVFMNTRSNHRAGEDDVQVSGRLQLHYEWKGGRWTLRGIENLNFRYSIGQAT